MFGWLRKGKGANAPAPASPAPVQPVVSDARTPTGPGASPAVAALRPSGPPPATAPARAPDPALAQAEFQRASQALAKGELALAEQHLRRAVDAQPTHADALTNLGALLLDTRRPDEAEAMLRRALSANPRSAAATFNLAKLLIARQAWNDAVAVLRPATSARPRDADVACWLGHALLGQGDAGAARDAYRTALRRDPRHAQARWGQTMAQLPALPDTASEQEEAPQAFARELARLAAWFEAQPGLDGSACVGAQQPFYLAYIDGNHLAELRAYGNLCGGLMGRWARRAGLPAPAAPARGRRHRVGIVSAHVQSHSVWHAVLRGWIERLDRDRFEIHLFHLGSQRDAETDWAERQVERLHQSQGDWAAWARCMAGQQLDAIIYPEIGMHATTARLASLRLARLQMAAWGHPITTGLPTIDAYISAQAFEPEDAATHYTESLVRLPGLGCSYRPYGTAPAVPDLVSTGIDGDDRVLLCPGTPFKYAPAHDPMWVEIARRCAPCKLVFFQPSDSALAARLQVRLDQALRAGGLDPATCLRFVPWQSQATFFGWLDRADVMLDSPGFSGFNTVMQAMERGTPIVAWEGRFLRSRFASGVLRQAGLPEWVAGDAAGFVERVERLCADGELRTRVRRQVKAAAPGLYRQVDSVDALGRVLHERLTPP